MSWGAEEFEGRIAIRARGSVQAFISADEARALAAELTDAADLAETDTATAREDDHQIDLMREK